MHLMKEGTIKLQEDRFIEQAQEPSLVANYGSGYCCTSSFRQAAAKSGNVSRRHVVTTKSGSRACKPVWPQSPPMKHQRKLGNIISTSSQVYQKLEENVARSIVNKLLQQSPGNKFLQQGPATKLGSKVWQPALVNRGCSTSKDLAT